MADDNNDGKVLEAAMKAAAAARKQPAADGGRAIADPRDVAATVLARMNMVNAKKDELTIAIKGLSDITQQLARAYGEQMKVMAGLAQRVKALEAAASARGDTGGSGTEPPSAPPGERTH